MVEVFPKILVGLFGGKGADVCVEAPKPPPNKGFVLAEAIEQAFLSPIPQARERKGMQRGKRRDVGRKSQSCCLMIASKSVLRRMRKVQVQGSAHGLRL